MNKFNIKKIDKVSIVLFLLICLTQVNLKIPNAFSINSYATVNIATIFFFIVFIALFFKILIKKEYIKEIKEKSFLLILAGLLLIYYILSTFIRLFTSGELVVSITVTYCICIGVLLYLIIYLYKINYDSIIKGINYFFVLLNVFLVCAIILNQDIRTLGVLGNVNIYISFVLINLPLIINYINKAKLDNKYKFILTIFIITSTLIILLLSGSRYALICSIIELIVCYFSIYTNRKAKEQIIGILTIVIVFIISSVICYNTNEVYKDRIERTFEYPIKIYNLMFENKQSEEVPEKKVNSTNTNVINSNNTNVINSTNIIYTNENNNEKKDLPSVEEQTQEIQKSENVNKPAPESLTREKLFKESIKEISENFWIGTGRPAIYIEGWGYQASHNYILEIMLSYGIIGACIYLALAAYPIIKLLKYFKQSNVVRIFLYSYMATLLYSMVEPILSNKIIIIICIWSIASALENGLKKENIKF